MTIKLTFKSNKEWREERAKSIGASSIGAIMGESRFTTPMQLADKMKAELRGEFGYKQTFAMKCGHAYEAGVAEMWSDATGNTIIKASSAEYLVRRDDLPFLHASPDRTYWINPDGVRHGKNAETNKGVLECKWSMRRSPITEDAIPLSWIFQLQMQMGICGYSEGCIAWHCVGVPGEQGFGYKFISFDKEMFDVAVEVCRQFWTDSVIGDTIPDPVNAADVLSRYPLSDPDKTAVATAEVVVAIDEYKSLSDDIKVLTDEKDRRKDKLISLGFADNEAVTDASGRILATYKTKAGSTTVDSKKLKAEYPDVYEAVVKHGATTRTLVVK